MGVQLSATKGDGDKAADTSQSKAALQSKDGQYFVRHGVDIEVGLSQ